MKSASISIAALSLILFVSALSRSQVQKPEVVIQHDLNKSGEQISEAYSKVLTY